MIKQIIQDITEEFGEDTLEALTFAYSVQLKEGQTTEDALEEKIIEDLYRRMSQSVGNYQFDKVIQERTEEANSKLERALAKKEERQSRS